MIFNVEVWKMSSQLLPVFECLCRFSISSVGSNIPDLSNPNKKKAALLANSDTSQVEDIIGPVLPTEDGGLESKME